MNVDSIKLMYYGVIEFEISVNDSIFSDNEQEKVCNTGPRELTSQNISRVKTSSLTLGVLKYNLNDVLA